MITTRDLQRLARRLAGTHGKEALRLADLAVCELEAQGDLARADAWRALKSFVEDVLDGRLTEARISIH